MSMLLQYRPYQVLLADTDGDDIRLRYTGNKELALGNPLPIVLMAAPPTKQGISQKYGLSYTGYETSAGSSEAYSVKTGITAGMWVGYEVSLLLDASVGFSRVESPAESGTAASFAVRVEKAEPAPLKMTPLDKKFLRSLKITVDHDEE